MMEHGNQCHRVVDDFGIKPNWHGSMMGNTTGFKAMSITKLSAIFHNVDVREIGLMSLLKSQIDDVFGKG